MNNEYKLECRYDSRKSFYGKAIVRYYENDDVLHEELLSYGTLVANYVYYKKENKEVFEYFGKYSQTTTRHQKEFFFQHGLCGGQIEELLKHDSLIIKNNFYEYIDSEVE